MTVFIGLLGFIVVIFVVIVIHESGHYFSAKLSGIRVDEFSFGFGPKITSKKIGETVYSWRALPLGGYVKMPGMLGLPSEEDAGDRNFYRAPILKRVITILAGILLNFVFGALCFMVVFAMPIPSVIPYGEATYNAGLRSGDEILTINGNNINHSTVNAVSNSFHEATDKSGGRPLNVTYKNNDGALQIQP